MLEQSLSSPLAFSILVNIKPYQKYTKNTQNAVFNFFRPNFVHYQYYKNTPCALTKFDRQARLVLILGGRAGPVCAPQVIAGAYLIFIISFTPTRFLDLKFTQQHTKVPLKRSNLTPDRKILHFLGELRHWRIVSDKYQVWSRRRLNCELQIPPNQVSSTTLLPCPKSCVPWYAAECQNLALVYTVMQSAICNGILSVLL